jgi:hypothetical protein
MMPSDKLDAHVVEVEEDDTKIFGVQTSTKSFHMHLLLDNCFISKVIYPFILVCRSSCLVANPWMSISKCWLICQIILGIFEFQTGTKIVFSLFSVLTTLKCYRLLVENFDQDITMAKNWPNNPQLNCMDYIKVKLKKITSDQKYY